MKIFLFLIISLSLWANIGNILALKGSVAVKRAGNTLDAKNGMELLKGDSIITQKRSRVQVMLKDDTVITIGASSSFSFEEYALDGKNSKVTMRANRGFFRSVTGKIGKLAPERFKVKTSSATIGIRGTDFSGDILSGREIFKCYQGAIFIKFDGNTHDVVAGKMLELSKDSFDQYEFEIDDIDTKYSKKENNHISIDKAESGEIATEVISDITQNLRVAEEEIAQEEASDDTADETDDTVDDTIVDDTSTSDTTTDDTADTATTTDTADTLDITSDSGDREEQY